MLKPILTTVVAAILFITTTKGQSLDHNKSVSDPLKAYFALDRENIHLHLNKDIYITNEKIWFKGYITEKKSAKPYPATSNVYINLLNSDGKIVLTNLCYSENSLFEGHINLDDKLKSGKYTIQAYTNFMNNFSEDESTLIPIAIINEKDSSYYDYKSPNYNALTISLFPESGIFLEGINNTIGVKIADCNGNGIAIENGQLIAPNGNVLSTFSTNLQGYAKFEIKNTENGIYKVAVEIENKKYQQNLPSPQLTGIAFTANNFAFSEKMVLHIKTNKRTLQDVVGKKFTFIIHQNDVVSSADFTLKPGETESLISIPGQYLSDGLNTIRLINSNHNQIGERIVFKPFPIKSNTEIKLKRHRADSLVFQGNSPLAFASLSISALPARSVALVSKNIYSSLYFDNYTKTRLQNSQYYFNNFNRKKHFELDNALITLNSKYEWRSMLQSPPQKKFDFDSGLTIKGTVNSDISNKERKSILMSSIYLGISEKSKLNSVNEFQFDNVMAIDSTMLYFSLTDESGKFSKLNMLTRLVNHKRPFLKSSIEKSIVCHPNDAIKMDESLPKIQNAIALSAVTVEGKNKKEQLSEKYKYRFNNNMARGYKITETEAGTFRDVLQWLASHGYNASSEGGRVVLTRNYSQTFQGSNTPSVFLDDAPLEDLDFLLNMSMKTIDEIYINKRGYGAGSTAPNGIIRIYTQRGLASQQNSIKINSQSLLVKDGYQAIKQFKNPDYDSVNTNSFQQFGSIAWLSNVDTEENGMFTFSIPNLHQDAIVVLVEGISADGQVISEQINVKIPAN